MLSRRQFLQITAAVSAGALITDGLSRNVAGAAALNPNGSNGIEHVVVLMMENRSFDHFLNWLPGANGKNDLTFLAPDGFYYPNYPLAPDYQGCGYSDPDHSWEGWLLQSDLPIIGALAQRYVTLDNYFCSFAGETYPNRFYQHAAQTDRDHNSEAPSQLPSIWDQLTAFAPGTPGNNPDQPWGGYYYRDSPFLALWYTGSLTDLSSVSFTYAPFFHAYDSSDPAPILSPVGSSFLEACAAGPSGGLLPNICFLDPAFDNGNTGTGGDDHPNSDIRLGERFIADAYHALADNGWLSNTVLIVTFDEWGGFYDHVAPPTVTDDTNPNLVNHTGDSTTPTDGQTIPNYTQLGFRVPAIVVTDLVTPGQVVHSGPFEHTSTLALIESTFGLSSLTARDANAQNLDQVLLGAPVADPVDSTTIPTSSDVDGPAISAPSESLLTILEGTGNFDPAAQCGETSVQSVSPAPVGGPGNGTPEFPWSPVVPVAVAGTAGMLALNRHYKKLHRVAEPPTAQAAVSIASEGVVGQFGAEALVVPPAEVRGDEAGEQLE
jgi:phospholipase C